MVDEATQTADPIGASPTFPTKPTLRNFPHGNLRGF